MLRGAIRGAAAVAVLTQIAFVPRRSTLAVVASAHARRSIQEAAQLSDVRGLILFSEDGSQAAIRSYSYTVVTHSTHYH